MKNTTAYLGKIHWVFLLAILYSICSFHLPHFLYNTLSIRNDFDRNFAFTIILNAIIYCGLGIITSKWKEAAISFGASLVISFFYLAILPKSFDTFRRVTYFFVYPVPLFLFIALQSRWQLKSIVVYFGILAASAILILNFFAAFSIDILLGFLKSRHELLSDILKIVCSSASIVFYFIILCELLNYLQNDNYQSKTLLLNLSNDYDKRNSLLTFWCLKTSLIVIAMGASNYISRFNQTYIHYLTEGKSDLNTLHLITGTITLINIILVVLFLGWYMRKALLEYFITWDIRSKFLYWLALVPFIGFLSFLMMDGSEKKVRYNEKVDSISNFASSSSAAITIVAFGFLFLRMIIRLSNTATGTYLSVILASLLFTWMIYSKAGYYMNAIVLILCLLTIIVFSLFGRSLFDEFAISFAFLLVGLAQLIMLFPVYHFDQFVYIPAENPEPDTSANRDLFS